MGLTLAYAAFLPVADDWDTVWVPAARAALDGQSPFTVAKYFTPPWALLPLLPFTADVTLGHAAWVVVSLVLLAIVGWKGGAGRLALALWLTQPWNLFGLGNANIDALVLAGLLLPRRYGLLVLVIKPQLVIGIIVLWTVDAWQRGRWRSIAQLWLPTTAVFGLSVLLYGWWPQAWLDAPGLPWNFALWPWAGPLGVVLLYKGIKHCDERYALAASPFLAPYVALYGYAPLALATVNSARWQVVWWVGTATWFVLAM